MKFATKPIAVAFLIVRNFSLVESIGGTFPMEYWSDGKHMLILSKSLTSDEWHLYSRVRET